MNASAGLSVRRYPGWAPPLVALHGFSQTGAMYAELAGLLDREVRAPDLPGHGRSSDVEASFDTAVAGVVEVLDPVDGPGPLLGYSQGGRVALGVAVERPDLVSHLILVSASPGIEYGPARNRRRNDDEALAARLTSIGLPAFLDEWLANPMFGGLQKREAAWQARDRAVRLENRAPGLAAALRGMGQGVQPYLGDCLHGLGMPVLLIAGALDRRYVALAEQMRRSFPAADLVIVPDTGHAVVGEQPATLANVVARFITGSRTTT